MTGWRPAGNPLRLQPGCRKFCLYLPAEKDKCKHMKKTYKIEVDCANCANLVEEAINKVDGVKEAVISFMTQKMKIEFEEGADCDKVMADVLRTAKKVESDFEIL